MKLTELSSFAFFNLIYAAGLNSNEQNSLNAKSLRVHVRQIETTPQRSLPLRHVSVVLDQVVVKLSEHLQAKNSSAKPFEDEREDFVSGYFQSSSHTAERSLSAACRPHHSSGSESSTSLYVLSSFDFSQIADVAPALEQDEVGGLDISRLSIKKAVLLSPKVYVASSPKHLAELGESGNESFSESSLRELTEKSVETSFSTASSKSRKRQRSDYEEVQNFCGDFGNSLHKKRRKTCKFDRDEGRTFKLARRRVPGPDEEE